MVVRALDGLDDDGLGMGSSYKVGLLVTLVTASHSDGSRDLPRFDDQGLRISVPTRRYR